MPALLTRMSSGPASLHAARDGGGVRDVERHVAGAELRGRALGRAGVAPVQHDVAARLVQPLRERAPDPAARAGDERRAAADVEHGMGHARARLARKSTRMSFLSLLTGSFSQAAAENPTVAMIEAAYRHHGIDARYVNCEVAPDGLGDAVRGARAMGWAGFNCSIPHKVAVIEHLDGLAESAAVIGAVNCAVRARRPADRREHRRPGLHGVAAHGRRSRRASRS